MPSPAIADTERPKRVAAYSPEKPEDVTSTSPPMLRDAPAPPELLTPCTARAAASVASASSVRRAVSISIASKRSRSRGAFTSKAGSASCSYGSSGATRAMATARSANLLGSLPALAETLAIRRPTNTRREKSSLSDDSVPSTLPSRTETLTERARITTASAWSAPARFAAATSCAARSTSLSDELSEIIT